MKVVDWSDYAADFLTTMAQDPVQILFYFFIVLVIVLISNTMLLSAMDRTREIGILRAMGMDDFDIFRMFALEAGLLGFFGAVIGLCIGAGISWIFVNNGITVTSEMLELLDKPYPVVGRIYAAWDYPAFFIAGIVSIVTAVVSAVIPTLSALKINIIEAIKMN